MGTSLTAEEMPIDKGLIQHLSQHLDSQEVLLGAQDLLHWNEEDAIQQAIFAVSICRETPLH